jgi:hypothetical protein
MQEISMIAALLWMAAFVLPFQVAFTRIRRGTVRLQINTLGINTLEPAISKNPVNYSITGYGPRGTSFDIETSEASVQIDELLIGEWNIIIHAQNETGSLIGQGSGPAFARPGTVETISIPISPIDAGGSFSLGVYWTPMSPDVPGVEAELIDASGGSLPLSFAVDSSGAVSSSELLDSGYYTLAVQLTNNGIPVMGMAEVVRIMTGALTTSQYNFMNVDKPGDPISGNITPLVDDAIEVAVTGQQLEIPMGSSMALKASAPSETTEIVYAWYLNGATLAIGSEVNIGADLDPGYYRVNVTAFTTDGKSAGSTTHEFIVQEGLLRKGSYEEKVPLFDTQMILL